MSILSNLSDAMGLMREFNPQLKFILTVSPVPLTATNSRKHVVVATMASKSVLRAVADQLATNRGNVDYFPSYEIVNSPIFKGMFFEPNQRNINSYGVNFVMDIFFQCIIDKFEKEKKSVGSQFSKCELSKQKEESLDGNEYCEEVLLEAFGSEK